MSLIFEWDEKKEYENQKKHNVDFDEAKTIFNDPLSITIHDPGHSANEHRFIDMGRSAKGRLLVVVYTERNNRIRIISCRFATKKEQEEYEETDK